MANRIPTRSRDVVKARERFRCARCGGSAPTGEWHHRRTRAVKDEWTHHWTNGVWLCKTCHDAVHAHPTRARVEGYIVGSFQPRPGALPVKLWTGEWVHLNEEGGYSPHQV